ncbi:MAG TPA: squalene synthase HpnC [Nitrospiria bacterium]|nr:squalene synthase HpnC [Nitrospiria bacterium]
MTRYSPPPPSELEEGSWTLEEAFGYCERLTLSHYENFPVGSRFIPKRLRPYVHSVYAFARMADDFADEPDYVDTLRLAFLENWENQLLQCVWRKPQHPVFIALKETIERFDLPVALFQDLLMAFKMDVTAKHHARFEDLLTYCRYSANPVGRLVLLLFDDHDPERHRLSDSICTALQLTNFWQDVAVDFRKNRIYLPQEDMAEFGYSEEDLRSRRCNEAFRRLMRHEIARTRELFHRGRGLCDRVGRDLRFELHLVWNGGMAILDRIENADYDVFSHRPTIGLKDKIAVVTKSAIARYRRQEKSSR